MSSYATSFVVPAPLAAVVPAGAAAAGAIGYEVTSRTPYYLRCRGAMSFFSWRVTIEMTVSGQDGSALASVFASNSGWGPIQTGACRDAAQRYCSTLAAILQQWAAAAAPPPLPRVAPPD